MSCVPEIVYPEFQRKMNSVALALLILGVVIVTAGFIFGKKRMLRLTLFGIGAIFIVSGLILSFTRVRSALAKQNSAVKPFTPESYINDLITSHDMVVISRGSCFYCNKLKAYLTERSISYKEVKLEDIPNRQDVVPYLIGFTRSNTVPLVFLEGKFIGGCDDTIALFKTTGIPQKLISSHARIHE